MDCSRCRVLACIACISDHCNAIDTLCRNHVHNKLVEGLHPPHPLELTSHTTQKRSGLSDNAPYSSKEEGTNFAIPRVGFLPSLRICVSDEILSGGALHQSRRVRPATAMSTKSVPHRSIRNHYIYTPSAPQEPIEEGSQCAPDARAGATHE